MTDATKPRVAVDVDSTLAAVSAMASNRVKDDSDETVYTQRDHDSWSWPINQFGREWVDATYDNWAERWEQIETVEPKPLVQQALRLMRDNGYAVDLLTHQPPNRPDVVAGKAKWVDEHELPFDGFVTTERSKIEYADRYVAFVDDKPKLYKQIRQADPRPAAMFTYAQPYNNQYDFTESNEFHRRVNSLHEVAETLANNRAMVHWAYGDGPKTNEVDDE